MKKRIILLFNISIAIFTIHAQDTDIKAVEPLKFEASYIGDNALNLSGGLKKGYNYLGFFNAYLSFDTEKARLWKKGLFYINAANTHGGSPSANLFGDMQVASNIEAGNHTFLQELWYKQKIGNVQFTFGLQDLNVELANTEYGGTFLNSSFGVIPIFSLNLHAPIFPLTSLGVTSKWKVTKNTVWLNALYDGSPTDFENNPYNIKWQLKPGDGILYVSELQRSLKLNNFDGVFKVGVFSHNHVIERELNKYLPDSLNTNTWGIYSIIDQEVLDVNDKNLELFLQAGYSPSKLAVNDLYLGLGLNVEGLLSKKADDVLGLAIAFAHLKDTSENETTIECTWQKPIGKFFFIQPDIQYIIHPSGQSSHIKNALATFFRFGFNF